MAETLFNLNRKRKAQTVWTCAVSVIAVVVVDGSTPIKALLGSVDALSSQIAIVKKREVARSVERISSTILGNDSICSRVLVLRICCSCV